MEELSAQLLYGSTTLRVGMQSSELEIITKVLLKLLEVLMMMPLPCKSEAKTALLLLTSITLMDGQLDHSERVIMTLDGYSLTVLVMTR